MTLYKPQLALRRLQVFYRGRTAYDQAFHNGVNIIAGENSSGKSTIADLILHALGGEVSSHRWKPAALKCDSTLAELEVSGQRIVLRRAIDKAPKRPLDIFWGDLASAQASAQAGWERYPYASTTNKQSFSQALFQAMGLPEVKDTVGSRVTMHQILRLLYADQMSAPTSILMQADFDSSLLREAIGDLMCGVHNSRRYEIGVETRRLESRASELKGQYDSALAVLGSEAPVSPEFVDAERENVMRERAELVTELEREPSTLASKVKASRARITQHQEQLRGKTRELVEHQSQLDLLRFEIEDSRDFILALEGNLTALVDALGVVSDIGTLDFRFCPACYVAVQHPKEGHCHLCRQGLPDEPTSGLARMRRELHLQLEESRSLLGKRERDHALAAKSLLALRREVDRSQRLLDEAAGQALPSNQSALLAGNRQLGYINRRLEDLDRRRELAVVLKGIVAERAEAKGTIVKLKDELVALNKAEERRRGQAYALVGKKTAHVLAKDLDRQPEFRADADVRFDFGSDRIFVDGETGFGASSMVVLKNSFHLALLLASLEAEFFNYPRWALFDNIEDKGMEQIRSHNFQRIVVSESESATVDHQIILTTSMLAPELIGSPLLVGDQYTHENRSLDLSED